MSMTWGSLEALPRDLCPVHTLCGQLHASCILQLPLAYPMLPVFPTPASMSPGTSSTVAVASERVLSTEHVVPEQWPLGSAEEPNNCLAMLMWPRWASGSDLRFSENEKLWGQSRSGGAHSVAVGFMAAALFLSIQKVQAWADGSGRASEEQVEAQDCARSLDKTTRATALERVAPHPGPCPDQRIQETGL